MGRQSPQVLAAKRSLAKQTADIVRDILLSVDGTADDRMAKATAAIRASGASLTRTHWKQIASILTAASRTDDAIAVLAPVMGRERATEECSPLPTAKVGDVLVSSWGYEQTNVDFYQVTEATDKSVRIVKLAKTVARRETTADYVVPRVAPKADDQPAPVPPVYVRSTNDYASKDDAGIGDEGTIHRIQRGYRNEGYCVRVSDHSHASLWDGDPRYQTGWGYGH